MGRFNQLSLKVQLIWLLTAVLISLELITLVIFQQLDQRERQTLAREQALVLAQSMAPELLEALVSGQSDIWAELSLKFQAFSPLKALDVLDQSGERVFHYRQPGADQALDLLQEHEGMMDRAEGLMLVRQKIEHNQHHFGTLLAAFDLRHFKTRTHEVQLVRLIILLAELVIGAMLVLWLIGKLSRPFAELVERMDRLELADTAQQSLLTEPQQPEMARLYRGFNRLLSRLEESSKALIYQANHDAMTGLKNRFAWEKFLQTLPNKPPQESSHHFVILLDINQFGQANTLLGTAGADALMTQFAKLLQSHFASVDNLVARLQADDFGLVLCHQNPQWLPEKLQTFFNKVHDFRFVWHDQTLGLSVNMGVLAYDVSYGKETLDRLLEIALNQAKAKGTNQYHLYTQGQQQVEKAQDQLRRLALLKRALVNEGEDKFQLFAQKIHSLSVSQGYLSQKRLHQTLVELSLRWSQSHEQLTSQDQRRLHNIWRWQGAQLHQAWPEWVSEGLFKTPAAQMSADLARQIYTTLVENPPKADASFAPVQAYEILIRMEDAQGNIVPPGAFLPLVEEYNLMVDLDIYVLESYFKQVLQYPQHLTELAFVNINLAGSTLNHPRFQQVLRQALDTLDFPWFKLVLEVTEQSAVGNLAQASDFIQEVRQAGIRVALDDFGTGFSSFEYLKHLPFDVVKIDGGFIRDMLDDETDLHTVKYMAQIAKRRGQEVIAEFVENEQQETLLKSLDVEYGQGYYLGKPQPLRGWLKKEQA